MNSPRRGGLLSGSQVSVAQLNRGDTRPSTGPRRRARGVPPFPAGAPQERGAGGAAAGRRVASRWQQRAAAPPASPELAGVLHGELVLAAWPARGGEAQSPRRPPRARMHAPGWGPRGGCGRPRLGSAGEGGGGPGRPALPPPRLPGSTPPWVLRGLESRGAASGEPAPPLAARAPGLHPELPWHRVPHPPSQPSPALPGCEHLRIQSCHWTDSLCTPR